MKENNKELAENGVLRSPASPPAPPGLPLGESRRATPQTWAMIKASYLVGEGSLRALAARYGVSESTTMKRAGREHWAAHRALASTQTDATVVATLQERAQNFVNRSAEQTDRFLTRVSESEAILTPEDRVGLRTLTGAFKDVVQIGRETYGLGNSDDERHCLVNLSFLQSYQPDIPKPVVDADQGNQGSS
jgi:hypothetical protein